MGLQVSAHDGEPNKKAVGALTIVNHLIWLLGLKPRASATAVYAFNHGVISPVPEVEPQLDIHAPFGNPVKVQWVTVLKRFPPN